MGSIGTKRCSRFALGIALAAAGGCLVEGQIGEALQLTSLAVETPSQVTFSFNATLWVNGSPSNLYNLWPVGSGPTESLSLVFEVREIDGGHEISLQGGGIDPVTLTAIADSGSTITYAGRSVPVDVSRIGGLCASGTSVANINLVGTRPSGNSMTVQSLNIIFAGMQIDESLTPPGHDADDLNIGCTAGYHEVRLAAADFSIEFATAAAEPEPPGCGTLTMLETRCNGNTLLFCTPSETLVTTDCTENTEGRTECRLIEGSTQHACLAPIVEPDDADPCADIPDTGTCSPTTGVITTCSDGEVTETDCDHGCKYDAALSVMVCKPDPAAGGTESPCGDITAAGQCSADGRTLTWCKRVGPDEVLATSECDFDCGWDETKYTCLEKPATGPGTGPEPGGGVGEGDGLTPPVGNHLDDCSDVFSPHPNEAWRCAFSSNLDVRVSQVCRNTGDGPRWQNFQWCPADCGACTGNGYNSACENGGQCR